MKSKGKETSHVKLLKKDPYEKEREHYQWVRCTWCKKKGDPVEGEGLSIHGLCTRCRKIKGIRGLIKKRYETREGMRRKNETDLPSSN